MLDLTHLNFSAGVNGSTPGSFPKACDSGIFYKANSYGAGEFYGISAIQEVVSSRCLRESGIQCVLYTGDYARLLYDGKEHITYVSISMDFLHGRTDMGLESCALMEGVHRDDAMQWAHSKGFGDWIDSMLVADFLVGNRDRHGSNIRLLSDGTLGSLFDFNMTLFMPDGTSRAHDFRTTNYLGGTMISQNLGYVQRFPTLREPRWEVVFEGITEDMYPVSEVRTWLEERRRMCEDFQHRK